MATTVGLPATNRAANTSAGYTFIIADNPAGEELEIFETQVYALANLTNYDVASFTNVGGNNFTTRDNEYVGAGGSGYQEFSIDIACGAGDYAGYYCSQAVERDNSGGGGYWSYNGDGIPSTNRTFTDSRATTRRISMNLQGDPPSEVSRGWTWGK